MEKYELRAEISTSHSMAACGYDKEKSIDILAKWLKEEAEKLPTNTQITLTFTVGENK